ncbi:MAG: NTP transferase domain-containing protein [Spirochaetes bacterium]|nr:NTP transferase domain-containing protein [Spirochaetota bacterium]
MKIIIPVAGKGTRLRPLTYSIPKVLLPVAGKLVIDYLLQPLLELNPSEIIFVTGYLGNDIEEYVRENYSCASRFIVQDEYRGLGHAISLASPYVGPDEPVLIVLGDTLFEVDLQLVVSNPDNVICVNPVEDIRRFGIVEFNDEEKICGFLEKPETAATNLAIVGIYYIRESTMLFKALNNNVQNDMRGAGGEIQLTDALQVMLTEGAVFDSVLLDNWLDCGTVETMLDTNSYLLGKNSGDFSEEKINTSADKKVFIQDGVEIENSKIGSDVSIGKNCRIKDSVIVNTIIGNDVSLNNVNIKNSIIGNNTSLSLNKDFRFQVIIGSNAEINNSG